MVYKKIGLKDVVLFLKIRTVPSIIVRWGSVVGMATLCGLKAPGIESQWGARFSAPVHTSPGADPAFHTMGTGSFPVGKMAWAWHRLHPQSSAEGIE